MKKNQISPTREISLAVEAVRDLENILLKAARKRKLTTEHRQKLLKCAEYLRKKRESARGKNIILPQPVWIKALRCIGWVLRKTKHVRQIFVALVGGE